MLIGSKLEIWDFQKACEVGTILKVADYVFPKNLLKKGKYAVLEIIKNKGGDFDEKKKKMYLKLIYSEWEMLNFHKILI